MQDYEQIRLPEPEGNDRSASRNSFPMPEEKTKGSGRIETENASLKPHTLDVT